MFLTLTKFNLSIFSFVACAFYVIYENRSPNPRSWRFTAMLSSKNVIVLTVTFKSLIILSKFLCLVWDKDLNSFFYMWLSSCPTLFVEKNYPFPPCWKSVDHGCMSLFLDSHFIPWICMSIRMPHCFDYCSFVVSVSLPICFFSRLFWQFGTPCNSIWILGSACPFLQKRVVGILIGIILNL